MPPAKRKTTDTRWAPRKATQSAVSRFEAEFGRDMGVDLADRSHDDYEVVSTGSLNLDYALGIGGLPTGRVVEWWGPEHAGKTSLCCLVVAEYQRRFPDRKVAWVDMEQTFDPVWAAALGVDVPALWRPPVKTAEETADFTRRFVESGLCSLVVLDSVGGMISRVEFDKEADEATIALVAKIVTRMVKQVSPMAKSNGTTVMVVNQVRSNIAKYGPDQTTAGGWALKHITSVKMQVRKGGSPPKTVTVDGDAVPVGQEITVAVQKNKLAPYGKQAALWLFNVDTDRWGPIGVDSIQETFDFAKRFRLLGSKGGGYYQVPVGAAGETEEVRGEDKAVQMLRDRPEAVQVLRQQVLATLGGAVAEEDEEDDGSDPLGVAEALG